MTEKRTYGIIAEFEDSQTLLQAAREVRDAGYIHFDAHSPFPIHGMDEAMGERRSPLGWIVGGLGLLGCGGALLLQWWTSAVDYPLVVGGKPFFSLPAFIPITFELTILLAAFGAVFGMLFLNQLPKFYHPLFYADRFEQVTDGGFFLSIEARDDRFDAGQTQAFLEKTGSSYSEIIYEHTSESEEEEKPEEGDRA
ncbi:MAG TPA: DUF3341 domain-containing protein [bacterium]|nr:DUF3341 domain-containing protein [bacterium]